MYMQDHKTGSIAYFKVLIRYSSVGTKVWSTRNVRPFCRGQIGTTLSPNENPELIAILEPVHVVLDTAELMIVIVLRYEVTKRNSQTVVVLHETEFAGRCLC